MHIDSEHRLKDNLGQTFLYTRWPQFEDEHQLRDEAVLPYKVFAEQHLRAVAESSSDPFHYRLLDLWLSVYQEPWNQPQNLHKLIEDLAEKIASGELIVYLEDSEMWRHISSSSAVSVSKEGSTQIGEKPNEPDIARKQSAAGGGANEESHAELTLVPEAASGYHHELNPLDLRKQRYQERKQLLIRTSGAPDVRGANRRLEFNNDNLLRAEAAHHVYRVDEYRRGHIDSVPVLPVGLELVDHNTVLGLEDAVFTSSESGFGAALFKSEISNEMMLVFRGTNNGVTGKKDWATNGMQGIGKESDQYNQAMDLARMAKQSLDEPFSIVGHSLGGGLASSAVAVTGVNGYTFNSAGLHPDTVARRGGLTNTEVAERIQTRAVDGEVLTAAQKHGNNLLTAGLAGLGGWMGGPAGAALGGLGGHLLPDIPKAVGQMQELPSVNGGNPVARHGMDQVIDGIEAQKEEDIAMLTNHLDRAND